MQKVSLLIVEDEPSLQQLLTEAMSLECNITVAGRGDQALAAAFANPPDLILLDVGLPDMTGYEICRQIKADARFDQTPIIFLTSYSDLDKELRGIEAGAIDYMTKPINVLKLRAKLKNHIAVVQARQRADK